MDSKVTLRLRPVEGPAGASLHELPLYQELAQGPLPLHEAERRFGADIQAHVELQKLWGAGLLELVDEVSAPGLIVWSAAGSFSLDLTGISSSVRFQLSRFALVRRLEQSTTVRLESAKMPGQAEVRSDDVLRLLWALREPRSLGELAGMGWDEPSLSGLLFLLRSGGFITSCESVASSEDEDPTLQQWEFHDLLFHTRSRLGRTTQPLGARFRFKGRLPPQPALKANPWLSRSIELPRPDMQYLAATDPSLTQVMENRRSIRVGATLRPLQLSQLGEFLYRVARVRSSHVNEFGEFTSRPYPSGGGSYELEIYVAVNVCQGLARGYYYYDAVRHCLSLVAEPCTELDALLEEAWNSAARLYTPQVLIVLASRFQRVSWKYSGMAYATQLKNAGVLLQTMYLVATAMGLAPCALGLGNTERFYRLSGTDYFKEGSIAEFLLGAGP